MGLCGQWLQGGGACGHNGLLSGMPRLLGSVHGPARCLSKHTPCSGCTWCPGTDWQWHGASREGGSRASTCATGQSHPCPGPSLCAHGLPGRCYSRSARPRSSEAHWPWQQPLSWWPWTSALSQYPRAWPPWAHVATGPRGQLTRALAHLDMLACALDGKRQGAGGGQTCPVGRRPWQAQL